ncbi:MAG: site-2 protease family protein [Butyricicoccus sp.]
MAALAGFLDDSGVAPLFFAAAALHEIGHALAVYACGGTVTVFRLTALGGVMRYRLPKLSMLNDIWIAAAGPLTGIGIAWLAAQLGWYRFAGANLLLSMLNLLPVRPLDGGQIVSALLHGRQMQLALEVICCLLLGWSAAAMLKRGSGCSLLLFWTALAVNLQKNLQKSRIRYKI